MQSEAEKLVREASNAHTRLNTFYTVIAVLESGCLPGGSDSANKAAEKIIKLCKDAAARQLTIYDDARLSIRSLFPEAPHPGSQGGAGMSERARPTAETDPLMAMAKRISEFMADYRDKPTAPDEIDMRMIAEMCFALGVEPTILLVPLPLSKEDGNE